MSRLYVHIGLPKTATTTLQESFFPKIGEVEAFYAGVFQPRSNRQSDYYTKFIDAITFGNNIKTLKNEIQKYISHDKPMIISEEMVLVSQPYASWRDKLKNLSEILDGLDYEVIVTVRQPEKAMFSYYVELLPQGLSRASQLQSDSHFYDFAVNNTCMEIFHYKKLLNELTALFDMNRVTFYKFEDIIESKMDGLYELLKIPKRYHDSSPFEKSNARNFKDGYVSTGGSVTWAELIKNNSFLMAPPLRVLSKKMISATKNVKAFDIKVKFPEDHTFERLKSLLCDDIKALKDFTGIDYN